MQAARHVILLRHGKAEAGHVKDDHARRLSKHGRQQLDALVHALNQPMDAPDRVLASDARRTRETAERLCDGLHWPAAELKSELYLAEAGALLGVLKQLPEEIERVLLVGHNPGISELLHRLADPKFVFGMSTGALAILRFSGVWQDLGEQPCALQAFIDPDELM